MLHLVDKLPLLCVSLYKVIARGTSILSNPYCLSVDNIFYHTVVYT